MRSQVMMMVFLLLFSVMPPATAYGKSVEDLVGSFSIGKTIKIGSSSECFSTADDQDPLTPPVSGAVGPLSDDQAPGIAGLIIHPQQVALASLPRQINLTAHIIDDQAVWAAEAAFTGPNGEVATAIFSSQNRTSGTSKDGIYASSISLVGNRTGEWHLQKLTMVDSTDNRKTLLGDDLTGMGLPTDIAVI